MNLHGIVLPPGKKPFLTRAVDEDGYPCIWFTLAETSDEAFTFDREVRQSGDFSEVDTMEIVEAWFQTPESMIRDFRRDYGLSELEEGDV